MLVSGVQEKDYSMYIYIYTHRERKYVCVCVCVCVYIHRERENMCVCVYSFPGSFPLYVLQAIEYSSLCYTVYAC